MRAAMAQLNLSAWVYHRILKLVRTIADLAESEEIKSVDLAEALQLQYRPKLMLSYILLTKLKISGRKARRGDSSMLAVSGSNAAQVTDICSRVTQCVVILFSGRPLIINTQLNQSHAFVAAWLPGTEGAGITDVLFGDYPFVGKLPVTWPNAVTQEPINSGDGKTGLFPFGFGITP